MAKPTIILVHGAWHGSWCWVNVVEALEADGFDAVAVDLPGRTPGSSKRIWNRMSSYVDSVDDAVAQVAGEVVVVGHSMGGYVVQRVLERRTVSAGVLVASIPRKGAVGASLRFAREDPKQFLEANAALSLWPFVANDDLVRQRFFGASTDDAVVAAAGSKLQNESYPAYLAMLARWPRPAQIDTPVHVVAASDDAVFTLDEQHDLARAYGHGEPVVLNGGHDLMLEPVWPELVAKIVAVASGVNA